MSSLKTILRLLNLFRPCWGWMLLGILLTLITILANVGLLALAGWFITVMGIAGALGITQVNYFTPAAAIRGLAIARTAGRYAERVITHEATFRLLARLRVWFYEHLEPLAPAVLQTYHSGDLLSRIRADIDHLQNFYLRILAPVMVAVIGILIIGGFLSRYEYNIMLATISFLIIAGVLLPLLVNKQLKKSGQRIIEAQSQLRSTVIDSIQGMGEILLYDAEIKQQQRLEHLSEAILHEQEQQTRLTAWSQQGMMLCANLALFSILLIAIPLVNQHYILPEELPMLAFLVLASFETILPLPQAFRLLPETLASARRVFAIVDSKPSVSDPDHPSPQPSSFDLEFRNVCFRYPGAESDTLHDLSFRLPQGKRLAIVGESGSGKTTICHLLLKFYEPKGGIICLGNNSLTEFHGEDLRRYFTVVQQQSFLFNSTIRKNLLLAKPEAHDQELETVCRVAQIHDFIMSQPEGYDTWVGEAGVQLSGGQVRRLVIARAILKDAPILILDEPGEGLDTVTEQRLIDAVIDYKKHASILLITHKKAALNKMDSIITLKKHSSPPYIQ